MKTVLAGLLIATASFALAGAAEAGCVKGAIVGGIAGHMAGHGAVGAAAGCAISHHSDAKKRQAAQQQQPK